MWGGRVLLVLTGKCQEWTGGLSSPAGDQGPASWASCGWAGLGAELGKAGKAALEGEDLSSEKGSPLNLGWEHWKVNPRPVELKAQFGENPFVIVTQEVRSGFSLGFTLSLETDFPSGSLVGKL